MKGVAAAAAKLLQSCLTLCVQPHRLQPTRLPHPWDSPGKSTGVGCHCLHNIHPPADKLLFPEGVTLMFCAAGTAKDDYGWHCLGRKQVTVRQSLRVKLAQNNECSLYSNDQETQSDLVT